jgi:hypothetical protein
MPENAVASAGTDGIGLGYMKLWDCIMITEFVTTGPESAASSIGPITLEVKITEKA